MASSWRSSKKAIAPFRRRLAAGAQHVRSAFMHCLPIGSSQEDSEAKKRKIQVEDEHRLASQSPDNDNSVNNCTLKLLHNSTSTATSDENNSHDERSLSSPNSSSGVETNMEDEPVDEVAKASASVIEPLRPRHNFMGRTNRTFWLRRSRAVSSKASEKVSPTKSTSSRPKMSWRPTRPTTKTNNNGSRPQFHGGKVSSSGCLMTFVIFTNGSSTRMWFLVEPRSNSQNSQDEPSSSGTSSTTPSPTASAEAGREATHHPRRPVNTSRRRNISTPSTTCEKKRSLINRFLCSEDGKCTGADGRSRLAVAASWACPAAIKLLLRRGAPVNSVDGRGKAALHYVAYGHSQVNAVVECLLLLLDAGAKVNCFDDENNTPLHLAALAGCGPAMGLLLRRGADSSLPNCTGRTPVFNFLNNAFNAENVPALLELANCSPYAFTGAFHLSNSKDRNTTTNNNNNNTMINYGGSTSSLVPDHSSHEFSATALFDSHPSKRLVDDTGRMPLVLKVFLCFPFIK